MFWDVLYSIGAVAFSSLGGGAILLALSSWLGKVWAGRILAQDQTKYQKEISQIREKYRREVEESLHLLRDRLDRGQFIHRLQFETEFKVYLELWGKLVAARDAAIKLRPVFDLVQAGKSEEEIKKERVEELRKTYVAFQDYFREREPFIAPEVYESLEKLETAIYEEGVDFMYGDKDDREYWSKGVNNGILIKEHTKYICKAIRKRIASTTVLPEETRPAQ